jgi:hypothetical protein
MRTLVAEFAAAALKAVVGMARVGMDEAEALMAAEEKAMVGVGMDEAEKAMVEEEMVEEEAAEAVETEEEKMEAG